MIPTTQDILQRLLRYRKVAERSAVAATDGAANTSYEVFSVGGTDQYHTVLTAKAAIALADTTAKQQPNCTVAVWSPLRGLIYRARYETPEALVDALLDYIWNSSQLSGQYKSVAANQTDLMENGTYDGQVAFKAFWPVADAAVDQYTQQYGTAQQKQFPHDIRQMMAEKMVRLFEQDYREQPDRFEQPTEPSAQQTIQIDPTDSDGKTIVINIG